MEYLRRKSQGGIVKITQIFGLWEWEQIGIFVLTIYIQVPRYVTSIINSEALEQLNSMAYLYSFAICRLQSAINYKQLFYKIRIRLQKNLKYWIIRLFIVYCFLLTFNSILKFSECKQLKIPLLFVKNKNYVREFLSFLYLAGKHFVEFN